MLIVGMASVAIGDVVHLVNGRTLEGIVREETDQVVVLDVGIGSITLPRSRIRHIERTAQEDRSRLQETWIENHWLHAKFVPEGMRHTASALRQIIATRRELVQAEQGLREHTIARQNDRQQERLLNERMAAVSRELQTLDATQARDRYNTLVAESNRLRAELALLADQVRQSEVLRSQTFGRTRAYRDALLACRAQVAKAQAALSKADSEKTRTADERFLKRAEQKLDELERDFSVAEIPVESESGSPIVVAAINGKAHGRFVLDTGAAMVVLTEAFADKIGLNWRHLPAGEAKMADGSLAEARYLTLDSVRLGAAQAGNVRAAVISSAGERTTDGLLGMSFLNRFHMNLDGAAGRIVLQEFKSR